MGALWLTACGAPADSGAQWPEPAPALWEVSSAQGETGWLFGTVHALPDGVAWKTPLLEQAVENSGVLVVEVADLDPGYGPALFETLSRTPGQLPLSSRVEPEERPALQELLDDAGMDDADFSAIETWAAALVLSTAVRDGEAGNGVDRALIAEAGEVVGLESYRGQMTMFDTLSAAAQSDLLYGVARTHAQDMGEETLAAWVGGDVETIGAALNEALEFSPELRRILLAERNARWAAAIADLLDAGRRPFVAVGAGHLAGEDNVAELLAERGYTVRRIQ